MHWVFWAMLGSAALHVVEEYFFPGGFIEAMRDFQPQYARFITVPFAVIINGLFLLLCLAGALISDRAPLFSLSVAALVGLNGLIHIGAALRRRGYAPGLVTGAALYLPLAIYAFCLLMSSQGLNFRSALLAILLAVFYQAVPITYLGLSLLSKKR